MDITFSRIYLPFGEFSNFWAHGPEIGLNYEGKLYATAEHLYQSRKYIYPGQSSAGLKYAELIRISSTPYKAKLLAKQQCPNRFDWQRALNQTISKYKKKNVCPNPKWEEVKLETMRQVLELKFEQDIHCREILIKSYPYNLVEISNYDKYWAKTMEGEGENNLGKLLMKIRDNYVAKNDSMEQPKFKLIMVGNSTATLMKVFPGVEKFSPTVPSVEKFCPIVPTPIVITNPTVEQLYEIAIKMENCVRTNTDALLAMSGSKTGRSPRDKRVVREPCTEGIWWGNVNIPLDMDLFTEYQEHADYQLHNGTHTYLFVVDAYANWDPNNRIRIRLLCSSAYHALFMRNMLIPADEVFDEPDFTIYNVGHLSLKEVQTKKQDLSLGDTLVALCFSKKQMVIYGTRYAGEMKKGILTLMMYLMPLKGNLCLHSSANIAESGDLTLFFGLSGTGKTTLSADPQRKLIGDDEHVWTDTGVFNVEGGCYAKCIDLSEEKEPDIFNAIRYGTVLENVVIDEATLIPNYKDDSITENTRAAYPLQFINNCLIPASVTEHPNNIVFLTCDTFGILPPISRLTVDQAVDFFIAGFTSKMSGTEVGVKEPTAVFSACFGEPFLVWQPTVYGNLLKEKLQTHPCPVWMLNTGWIKGPYGTGHRISINDTRFLLDKINNGELSEWEFSKYPVFDFEIPVSYNKVPGPEYLDPRKVWPSNGGDYLTQLDNLKLLFDKNLKQKTN